MSVVSEKSTIAETFETVRKISFEEKRKAMDSEQNVNNLLDRILEFKASLVDTKNKIDWVVEKIEKLTWFNDLDSEALMSLNDLISSIRDLHTTFLRRYVAFNNLRKRGIAKEEIVEYKASIDDLKDVAADLESRFFFLPAMKSFQETTKELSLL